MLTWSALPTTEMMLSAWLSANSVIHELSTSWHRPRTQSASSRGVFFSFFARVGRHGMIVCAGSLAKIARLLGPDQRALFNVRLVPCTFLFRTLISPAFPNFRCHKSSTPWSTSECELDWSGGRAYVVKVVGPSRPCPQPAS